MNDMRAIRIKAVFAGIPFTGFTRPPRDHTITVPVPALRKILRSRRVTVHCTGHFTDDYAGDNATNFGRGIVDPAGAEETLELGKPWLCYLDQAQNIIRFCPYRTLNYTIRLTKERREQ